MNLADEDCCSNRLHLTRVISPSSASILDQSSTGGHPVRVLNYIPVKVLHPIPSIPVKVLHPIPSIPLKVLHPIPSIPVKVLHPIPSIPVKVLQPIPSILLKVLHPGHPIM